jgi:hypothetical protein
LAFGIISAQSQGNEGHAPSPKPRQEAKNPRSALATVFLQTLLTSSICQRTNSISKNAAGILADQEAML